MERSLESASRWQTCSVCHSLKSFTQGLAIRVDSGRVSVGLWTGDSSSILNLTLDLGVFSKVDLAVV